MHKGLIFLGILTVFLLLAPYLGIHPFGKPVPTILKPQNNVPVKHLENLDLMDPVEDTSEDSNS